MQIQLTSDIETALAEYARTQGLPPDTLALKALREYFLPSPETGGETEEKKETLTDYPEEHIGGISSSEHAVKTDISMQFRERVARLAEKHRDRADDTEKERMTWIAEVRRLYENIEEWFGELTEAGYMSVEYSQLEHIEHEDFSENISIMELCFAGGSRIIIEPTGTNIIGAFGKADLYFRGHREEKVLLLLIENEDRHLRWELWKSSDERDKFPFTRNTFEKLLNGWLEKWAEI
ncbi:hypothetical protein QUF72_00540 [Desulfobacterales bacterium HSG2]|nr:hypothetical protein [Desulfobacterales bacterium HSG2]MDM8548523.1 hypothetical protein [Desulfobacterales bacterium HSG2]